MAPPPSSQVESIRACLLSFTSASVVLESAKQLPGIGCNSWTTPAPLRGGRKKHASGIVLMILHIATFVDFAIGPCEPGSLRAEGHGPAGSRRSFASRSGVGGHGTRPSSGEDRNTDSHETSGAGAEQILNAAGWANMGRQNERSVILGERSTL